MRRIGLWILFCYSLFIGMNVEAHQYKVLGIGAPCIDILVKVEDEVINSLGSKGGSKVVDPIFIQNLLTRLSDKHPIIATGGSCSNTIKGLANLGHSCGFFGKRGLDQFGELYVNNITELGIIPLISTSEESATQICICLISPDGDRTMRCLPGAASELTSVDLTPDLFKGVKLVHLEGYNLYMKDSNFVENVMHMAKKQGAMISLDLSSFELVNLFKPKIFELLEKYVDVVFANADEIKALTGFEPFEGCKILKEICPIAVVMTGKEGCIVGSGDKIITSPGNVVNVVDTTGAGDLFVSGFLHGLLEDLPLTTCAMYGNLTGAAVVGVYGAEISTSKWDEIKDFNSSVIEWQWLQSKITLNVVR